jgi:ferredoxin
MCTFCVKHGDGKRWYLNAASYAADLESDLSRRRYMVGFVRDFERFRRSARAGLAALRFVPRPLREGIAESVSLKQQRDHFGQPVPIEDCEQMLSLATNITRLPCVCRGAMKPGSNAESCCLVATVLPHDEVLADCFRDYRGGPDAEGFQKLTKDEALALLRAAELRGLAHTAWTFGTPFVAAICNCDLPSGCLAMTVQLRGGIRVMWRGEEVARLDPERCSGCGLCVPRCPFGALRKVRRGEVALDRAGCWGCGTCRASCAKGALALEPRSGTADVASVW